jgi:lipopolysaccharide transport system ATP-binding protein
MSDLTIRVEGLGKRYRIGQREPYKALRDVLAQASLAPFRWLRSQFGSRNGKNQDGGYIWALRDVSFEVKRGEVIGIIGRNGAGKSTLLKILSRITKPTKGYAEIYGRVGSILEVGTGFHPELTGRENVYLNGAILGMQRSEIERKFDAIVDFAGIDEFMDTPVKRYSSGMYVRLAFAVAAHLEPEILLVDEVLAVGDAEFQRKCLGRMGDFAGLGKTVLFVSHNLSSILALTNRTILLEGGQVTADGASQVVVEQYLAELPNSISCDVTDYPRQSYNHGINIRINTIRPEYENEYGFYFGDDLIFVITLSSNIQRNGLSFGATVLDISGSPILSVFSPKKVDVKKDNPATYKFLIEDHRLAPGTYNLALSVFEGGMNEPRKVYDLIRPGILFSVASLKSSGEPVFRWARSYGSIVHMNSSVTSKIVK